MARDITIMIRELSPFEKRILELVCEGKSNSAIATTTAHTGKVIENTVSRSAQVFGIKSDTDTNLRVLLALAFRSRYGDQAFDKLHEECIQHEIDADGRSYCNGVTKHEDTKI